MSDTTQRTDWQRRIEQRISDLEAKNTILEEENEALKQRQGSFPVTRRQTLFGLLGGGMLLGATGTASATPGPWAPDEHDHSGKYGTATHLGKHNPVDRLDVTESHVGELSNRGGKGAVIQTAWDGMVVPIAPGLGANDAIDPRETDTPVQDALDAVANVTTGTPSDIEGGGRVILPPEPIEEATTIEMRNGVQLLGQGAGFYNREPPYGEPDKAGRTPERVSKIQVLEEGVDLLVFDEEENMQHNRLDGFILEGPRGDDDPRDGGTDTGVGIHIGPTTGTFLVNCTIGDIQIINLSDSAIKTSPEGGQLVQCDFGAITAIGVDAAHSGHAVYHLSPFAGFSSNINVLSAYPQNHSSGESSDVLRVDNGGNLNVNVMNIGADLKRGVIAGGFGGVLRVGTLNYEPDPGSGPHTVIETFGSRPFYMGPAIIRGGTLDRYCRIRGPNPKHNSIGMYRTNDATTELHSKGVVIEDDTTGPNLYHGMSDDVENTTGQPLSEPVACLGDLTLFE